MSVVEELIAVIHADPKDESSQLVIADYLQADGDPRGELIVLDHADRNAMLEGPEALDQLLLLAATYSFPRATPDPPMLPYVRRRSPDRYEIVHDSVRYTLDCAGRGRWAEYSLLTIPVPASADDYEHHHGLEIELGHAEWTDEEERVVLTIVSDVIRAQTPLDNIQFPYQKLPLPHYAGSPFRCYQLPPEFLGAHDLLRNERGLAARDYHRWHAIWKRLRAMRR